MVHCLYFHNTSFILLNFSWNELYFKYTLKFEKKYINLGNLPKV